MELTKSLTPVVESDVISTGTSETIQMKLSEAGMQLLIDSMTNLYADPARAMLRETVSNARDAVIAAGNGGKVNITCNADSRWSMHPILTVADEGVGMDRETLARNFSQYGESTKPRDFSQIGSYGLGSKSPLAFADSFILRTVKDGIAITASIGRKNGMNVCEIDNGVKVDEPNGTKITIPLPSGNSGITSIIDGLHDYDTYSEDDILVINRKPTKNVSEKNFLFLGKEEGFSVYVNMDTSTTNINAALRDHDNIDITFVVGGFPYKAPARPRWATVAEIVVFVNPGILKFPPARDSIMMDARYESVVSDVRKIIDENLEKNIRNEWVKDVEKLLVPGVSLSELYDAINKFGTATIAGKAHDINDIISVDFRGNENLVLSGVEFDTKSVSIFSGNLGAHSFDFSAFGDFADYLVRSLAFEYSVVLDNGSILKRKGTLTGDACVPTISNSTPKIIIRDANHNIKNLDDAGIIVKSVDDRSAVIDLKYGFQRWEGLGGDAHTAVLNPRPEVEAYLASQGVPVVNSSDIRAQEKARRIEEARLNRKPGQRTIVQPIEARVIDIDKMANCGVFQIPSTTVELDPSDDFKGVGIIILQKNGSYRENVDIARRASNTLALRKVIGKESVDKVYLIGFKEDHYDLRSIRKLPLGDGEIIMDTRSRVPDFDGRLSELGNDVCISAEEAYALIGKMERPEYRNMLRHLIDQSLLSGNSWEAGRVFRYLNGTESEWADEREDEGISSNNLISGLEVITSSSKMKANYQGALALTTAVKHLSDSVAALSPTKSASLASMKELEKNLISEISDTLTGIFN